MKRLAVILILLVSSFRATAASIEYALSSTGGQAWSISYAVTVGANEPAVDEFTIYFDRSLYTLLRVATVPAGWDGIAIQPDSSIPADGYFDAVASAAGLIAGQRQAGFTVEFQYLGTGTPGAQAFEIVDPQTWLPISSGYTVPAVPEPGRLSAWGAGVLLVTAALRRRRARPSTQL